MWIFVFRVEIILKPSWKLAFRRNLWKYSHQCSQIFMSIVFYVSISLHHAHSFEVRTFVWDTSNPSDYWFIALKFDHIWWQICELKDDNVKIKLKVLKSISLFKRKTFLSIVFCIMLFCFIYFYLNFVA